MATPIDVVVFKYRKTFSTENRWNRALFTGQKNKISAPSQTVATALIAPNICHCHPQHLAHKFTNAILIGSFSAEL